MVHVFPRPLKCPLSLSIGLAHRHLGHFWRNPPLCPYYYLIKSCDIQRAEYAAQARHTSTQTAADERQPLSLWLKRAGSGQTSSLPNNSAPENNSANFRSSWSGPEVKQFNFILWQVDSQRGKWDECSKQDRQIFISRFCRRFLCSQKVPHYDYHHLRQAC